MLGAEAPDEDPISPNGNTLPIPPPKDHFHANQHNHFLGPLQHHEHDDIHNDPMPDLNQVAEQPNMDSALQQPDNANWEQDDEDLDMPGRGHWALPQPNPQVDQELHQGEFLEIHDLMEPMQVDEHVDLPDMVNNS